MNPMRLFFLIIVSLVVGCGSNAGTGEGTDAAPPPAEGTAVNVTVRWDPPAGYTQLGSVRFVDEWAGGITVCDLKPSSTGSFSCTLPPFAAGVVLHFGIVRDDPRTRNGIAWVFDRSCDGPWSGCGKDFGAVSLWKGTASVAFTYEPGKAGAPYWNAVVTVP